MNNWINWVNFGKAALKTVADCGVIYIINGVVDRVVPKDSAWRKVAVGTASLVLGDAIATLVNERIDIRVDSMVNTVIANEQTIKEFAEKVTPKERVAE